MEITFWGVRGSYPVPGAATVRYGGQTSCVEVRAASGASLIVDAGTGLRALGQRLAREAAGKPGEHHILLSHVHWDHIQGLPFFAPFYTQGNHMHVFARQREDQHLQAVFASQTEDPYFPVPLTSVRAELEFHELVEGAQFAIGGARVSCTRLNHPWVAMAYRIDADNASMVYASDTAPFADVLLENEFIKTAPVIGAPLPQSIADKLASMRASLVAMCQGADVLIYDTQFTPEEYKRQPHWGHSTPDDAIAVAREAGVKTLCLYHHAPMRSDDAQDAILLATREQCKRAGDPFEVVAAFEGLELTLGDED